MGFLSSAKTQIKASLQDKPDNDKKKFYPVRRGQSFCGRYTVQSRLGSGRYASVWLVNDIRDDALVALKILNSDFYNGKYQLFELEVMQRISAISAQSRHPGRHHVAQLRDWFELQGPTGRHVCLVMPLLGASIAEKTTTGNILQLSPSTVSRIAKQMLLALSFLHDECGVIHTDIQPSNILQDLEDHTNAVCDIKSQRQFPSSELNSPSSSFRLNDLGIACFVDRHLTDRIQSPYLRAPEITLEAPWDPSVDTYSLGCLMYQFITGDLPFPGRTRGRTTAEEDRLATLVSLFGSVPDVVLSHSERGKELGQVSINGQGYALSFERMIEQSASGSGGMRPEEIPIFCDLMRRMLATDPRKRESAGTLLRHPWLA